MHVQAKKECNMKKNKRSFSDLQKLIYVNDNETIFDNFLKKRMLYLI